MLHRCLLAIALGSAAPAGSAQDQPAAPPPPVPAPAAPGATPGTVTASGAVSQTIWPGIVRWYASADAKQKAPPSVIVQIPAKHYQAGPESARVVPTFGEADGRHTVHIGIEPGTTLYGCGVVPRPLVLNGRTFVAAPADRDLERPAEHASSLAMPWVVAVRPDGSAFGVMADTTWRTEIDLTDGITLRADGPALPVVVVDAEIPIAPAAALSQLAGWQDLPARWALGLHVGENDGTRSARGVHAQVAAWRERRIPLDVVWLSAVTTGLGAGAERASIAASREMIGEVRGLGVRVGLAETHLNLVDHSRVVFEEGRDGNHWLSIPNGDPYAGPGTVFFPRAIPDLTSEKTRRWWAGLYQGSLSADLDALGDTSVEFTIPGVVGIGMDEARAQADPELGGAATFAAFRGVFGALLARTAREAFATAFPERRPLVTTSVPSLISQRYGYTFVPCAAGGAADAIPMILGASMSGQAMAGIDLAGGDPRGDGSDLARDLAVGSLLPMLRLGAVRGEPRTLEPWAFSPEVEKTCREALERRSRLLPYLYTLAVDAYRFGYPMVRPLFVVDPKNPRLRDVGDAFLLGENILVRLQWPHAEPGPESILPGWRRFDFGETSPLLPQMYIRPGAIVPVGPVKQHDSEQPLEPLTLLVCLDDQGSAFGALYEDDGDGFAYRSNTCRMGYYGATTENGEVTVRLGRLDGAMGMAKRKLIVRVLLPDGREASGEYWDALDTKVKLP